MRSEAMSPLLTPQATRKYPRVRLLTPAKTQKGDVVSFGRTGNLSEGGLLILSRDTFPPQTEVTVCFQLSPRQPVDACGRIVHALPSERMGIQFVQLREEDRTAIARFVWQNIVHSRRSPRVPRRIELVLLWRDLEGNLHEESAETKLISRYGGLLLCPSRFKAGTKAVLLWPERQQQAEVKFVYCQLGTSGELTQAGFEFVGVDNFWRISSLLGDIG